MSNPESNTAVANSQQNREFESLHIPVQVKLAAAWTSFMFLYIYVDYFALYKPGYIDDLRAGIVWEFGVSQFLMMAFVALIAIPSLMVVLSIILPAHANRMTNLIVAAVYVPVSVFNAAGESWTYYYALTIGIEVVLLALILRYAWTWPRRVA